jgi:hypothetical protein
MPDTDFNDPGRLATAEECGRAWEEVSGLLEATEHWNLPKAAEHIRNHPPSAEAIALGLWAIDIINRSRSQQAGTTGGRPKAEKPSDIELRRRYDMHLAACGSEREARAMLVKDLQKDYRVGDTTARSWLRQDGIR